MTTRSFCPLCDWHHDQDDTVDVPPAITVDADILASGDLVAIASAVAHQTLVARLGDAEDAIRAHLETHELIEWVTALQAAKQRAVSLETEHAACEESVVGALNERNTRDCRRADKAEAQVAAVRAYADSLYSADRKIDACGVREKLYELLPMAPATHVEAGFRWHVLSQCPDETACPIHGRDDTEPTGPEDGVDLPELTRDDAVEAMQDMATELYRAEDRLAFVREMCELADREQRQITTEQVRAWTQYTGCANATPDGAELARSLGFALAAMQPGAEPVFCHHPDARRSSYDTMQAGWGRQTVVTLECPTCNAKVASAYGEPVLAPTLLNAARCTQACTERHTYRDGCLMGPDWTRGQR